MTLTEADCGGVVNINVGDTVVVQLAENAASGYRWAWEECPDETLEIVSANYIPTGKGVGGGGYARWTLRTRLPGKVYLRLKQWRLWEGDASVLKRFQVLLTVAA
jgi:inhibitor of cysteine peptidase